MKDPIILNENDEFELVKVPKNWNTDYLDNLIRYLNCIYPVFKEAKLKSDFEFIFTLTGFRGLQDPGWNPFENTLKIFDNIDSLKPKDEETKLNLFLWVYGHIIEASEPYEILANLLRIIDNQRYSVKNFPDNPKGNYSIPQFPAQKIEKLTELANQVNMPACLIPINEIFNRKLRNGIFHSDYSIHNGGVRVHQDYLELNGDETYLLINRAMAYFQATKYLYTKSIEDYKEPIEIDNPAGFHSPKSVVMIRKNHGVIGLKDNWTRAELAQGLMPFRMGKFKWHELEILKRDSTVALFPEDKTIKVWNTYNKLRNWTPKPLKKYWNSWYEKKLKRTQNELIESTVANAV